MNDFIYFLTALIGLCSSFFGSLMGAGGGFLNVPYFIFLGYADYSTAISLFAIIFNGINASIFNLRKKLIDFKISITFIPLALMGGILGAWVFDLLKTYDINIYKLIFTVFLIMLGIKIYLKEETDRDDIKDIKVEQLNKKSILFGIVVGFVTGFFGSFLGIGGGLIAIPSFIFLFDVSTHVAIATSLFVMIFTSISGLLTHSFQGNFPDIALIFGIFLAIGAVIGANIGSRLAYRLKGEKIRKLYGIVQIGVGIPLMWLRIFIPSDPIQIFMDNIANFIAIFHF